MEQKKKIIHLIPTLERGGSEMSQLRMLPLLNDSLESVFITLKEPGSLKENFERSGIKVLALHQKSLYDLASYWRLKQMLDELSPDLIVTHLLYADIVGRFFVQVATQYRVVASLATTYNFPSYWPAQLFEKLTHRLCTGYMANAHSVKKAYIEKFHVPEKKITVLVTGMDTEFFDRLQPKEELRRSLGINTDDIVIICVANLHPNKGHAYLLDAFESLFQKHKNIRLLIVGDGIERDRLAKQIEACASKERILFLGKRSDVPDLLALSHIFALATFFEGMCNAIMEGMASGLPIVTTDIPENRELVTHEKTGLLCPKQDDGALTQAFSRLIENPDFRKALGKQAAEEMYKTYNLAETSNRWKNFFLSQSQHSSTSRMEQELYEASYQNPKHFSFGKNWQNFLRGLDAERIRQAEQSLTDFLGGKQALAGKSFIDIGSGSGLFSLAAYRLGTAKVISFDIDEFSLACVKHLRSNEQNPAHWEIISGSALDRVRLSTLGSFDIVYSWGVLHHTGDMYRALENLLLLTHKDSLIYVALYNDNQRLLEGTSALWLRLKRIYNHSSLPIKKIIEILYTAYYVIGLAANWKNPLTYIRNYRSLRGMNFFTDIKDWLGGYPYEYADSNTIISWFDERGYRCEKLLPARSIGCNEYLFVKKV